MMFVGQCMTRNFHTLSYTCTFHACSVDHVHVFAFSNAALLLRKDFRDMLRLEPSGFASELPSAVPEPCVGTELDNWTRTQSGNACRMLCFVEECGRGKGKRHHSSWTVDVKLVLRSRVWVWETIIKSFAQARILWKSHNQWRPSVVYSQNMQFQ